MCNRNLFHVRLMATSEAVIYSTQVRNQRYVCNCDGGCCAAVWCADVCSMLVDPCSSSLLTAHSFGSLARQALPLLDSGVCKQLVGSWADERGGLRFCFDSSLRAWYYRMVLQDTVVYLPNLLPSKELFMNEAGEKTVHGSWHSPGLPSRVVGKPIRS